MSAITPNPFAAANPAALPFEYQRPGAALATALMPAYREPRDGIGSSDRFGPGASFGSSGGVGGYANGQTNIVQAQFTSLLAALMEFVSSSFAQLGSLFKFAGPATALQPGGSAGPAEQYFKNASASSVGDPHESFRGTTASGAAIDTAWDSMSSHANLLSSGSFDGGYRVSTTVTQPGDRGVTYNERATVATDGGNTTVSLHKDGSTDVTSYGRHVELETGHAVRLSDGESVMRNADGSLTIDDANGRGGSMHTTLRSTGSGVDVETTGNDVALGGYLVSKHDGDTDPVALAAQPGAGSYPLPQFAPLSSVANDSLATHALYAGQPYEPETDVREA